jgi:hypothetical protein
MFSLLRTHPNKQIADTVPLLVAESKPEQALVAGNRELITRFEVEIQATPARVWGYLASSVQAD